MIQIDFLASYTNTLLQRRIKPRYGSRYVRTNEVLVMGVFLITVINVLLAAFTTTDKHTK